MIASARVIGIPVTAAAVLVSWILCRPVRDASASSLRERDAPAASGTAAAPVVVELFTSEGCSSCPPADDLLRRIANGSSSDGQPIVAMSEHVTYWNQLGWADPFSQDAFSFRQDRYGASLRTSEVYTPQMVVNGRVQFVGSDRAAVARGLHAERGRPSASLSITEIRRNDVEAVVRVRSGAVPGGKTAELWAAVTDDSDNSNVLRGENGGRTLRHAAVVRSLVRVGQLQEAGEQTVTVPLPAEMVRAAGKGHHIALLAQLPGQGPIVGATLAPL